MSEPPVHLGLAQIALGIFPLFVSAKHICITWYLKHETLSVFGINVVLLIHEAAEDIWAG